MTSGESPYECARRETEEEIKLELKDKDLHCFGYISEKNYEGSGHWLMFLFNVKRSLEEAPPQLMKDIFNFSVAQKSMHSPYPRPIALYYGLITIRTKMASLAFELTAIRKISCHLSKSSRFPISEERLSVIMH